MERNVGDKNMDQFFYNGSTNVPGYLYHYTSIGTLAMILKTRKIKFSQLTKVDDFSEGRVKDLKHLGEYIFISCWTDEVNENVALWRMYAGMKDGVRIRMTSSPFKKYKYTKKILVEKDILSIDSNSIRAFSSYVPAEYFVGNVTCNKDTTLKPFKMYYYDDDEIITNGVRTKTSIPVWNSGEGEDKKEQLVRNMIYSINPGLSKGTLWRFQNEWRYRVVFEPVDFLNNRVSGQFSELKQATIEPYTREDKSKNIYGNGVFFDVSSEAFRDMKITTSPWITEENMIIVGSLINEYNKEAEVSKSCMDNRT
jgi:hypothetical protein